LEEVDERWEENDSQKAEVVVCSYKKDIVMELFRSIGFHTPSPKSGDRFWN